MNDPEVPGQPPDQSAEKPTDQPSDSAGRPASITPAHRPADDTAWTTTGAWPGASDAGADRAPSTSGRRGPFEATLFDTNLPPWRYVLRVWPLATLPTLGIATVLALVTQLFGYEELFDQNQWDFNIQSPALLFAEIVIGAPLLETMLMAPLLALLRKFVGRRWWVIGGSALVWAIMHSLSVPIWGVCIFWTFVIFSAAFEAWRPRGFWYAYFVTAGIHALNNALAGLGLLM
ncbi:MAG: hypothetical protein HN712_10105 [Gemmatimonadetes bacterium]|jgi:hypothetical protein|nr:hypothetical protein [Gemmatimonadota bacterium]MBT7860655.1 hypothetical protein [Gemmatimonadota bacterium]